MRGTGPHYSMDRQGPFQRSGNILVTALSICSIIWFKQACLRRRAAILSRGSHHSRLILGGIQDQVPGFRQAMISIGPVAFNCGGNLIRLRGPCPSPVMDPATTTTSASPSRSNIQELQLFKPRSILVAIAAKLVVSRALSACSSAHQCGCAMLCCWLFILS